MSDYKKEYNDKILEKARAIYSEFPDYCLGFFSNKKTPLTQYSYAMQLKVFFDYLHDHNWRFDKPYKEYEALDFASLTFIDADHFANSIASLKPSTQRHYRSTLLSFFNYLIGRKYITVNPFLAGGEVESDPDADSDIHDLSHDEQLEFLDTVSSGQGLSNHQLAYHDRNMERNIAICYLFLTTGIRISELVGIDINDLHLNSNSVTVARKGKKYKPDIVYMSDTATAAIREYLTVRKQIYKPEPEESALFLSEGRRTKDEDGIFHSQTGKRISVRAVERLVKRYIEQSVPEKMGEISPHKLRTSFAMTMLKATDNDLLSVAEMLNHKGLGTVRKYVKATDETRKKLRNSTGL